MSARRVLAAVALVASTCLGANAYAVPVPTGSQLIVNFDFTSPPQSPAPTYDTVEASFLTSLDTGENLTVKFFDDLNGVGYFRDITVPGSSFGTFVLSPNNLSEFLDGVFSLGFQLSNGAADVSGFVAVAAVGTSRVSIDGTVVPAPATLALLGLGLAGLRVAKRRGAH